LKLTTDRYEASRGIFATAELLVIPVNPDATALAAVQFNIPILKNPCHCAITHDKNRQLRHQLENR